MSSPCISRASTTSGIFSGSISDGGGSIRTFALTRIARLRNTGQPFERPEGFSLDEHLADSFGVFSSPEAQLVRLRFDAFSARLICERQWHASQHVEPLSDGGLELSMHVGISPEIDRWILGWGEHVEVIEPTTFARIHRADGPASGEPIRRRLK